jgi:hypothetical protein
VSCLLCNFLQFLSIPLPQVFWGCIFLYVHLLPSCLSAFPSFISVTAK